MKAWRLKEGPGKKVFFTHEAKPGGTLAVDWTDTKPLGITVESKALDHKLFHAVLPYSNRQWNVRAQGGLVLSLRSGLKATRGRPGRVPRKLLTDRSSTATHQLCRDGARRGFNDGYLAICAHYGLEPRVINVARPQENGSCESAHGHLKRCVKQHLPLRGCRDFPSEEEYDRFLIGVLESANRLRAARVGEELAAMRETTVADLPDYREADGHGGQQQHRPAAQTGLFGTQPADRQQAGGADLRTPHRAAGRGRRSRATVPWQERPWRGHRLPPPYRPLAAQAKGAFANYRWREELFPAPFYRAAYDHPERADRRYLELLKLAADEGRTAVENAPGRLLGAPRPVINAAEARAGPRKLFSVKVADGIF